MRSSNEQGAVALLVAILSFSLIAILAFVTDFGFAYVNQRSLQNASDAAVLAAGSRIVVNSTPGQNCSQVTASTTQAQADALAEFNANASSGGKLASNAVSVSCVDPNFPGLVVIKADATQSSTSFFGKLLGYGSLSLSKPATAIVGPTKSIVGIRPFALCDPLAAIQNSSPNAYVTVNFSNADLGCGTASGNFGTLDMRSAYTPPATSPVNGCPGSLVNGWISSGYPGSIPTNSPLYIQGDPGNPAANFAPDLHAILDQSIVIPTFDQESGNGCNGLYRITGFIETKVCGYNLNPSGNARDTGACFSAASAPSNLNDRFVQLQFTRFIPIGSIDLTCKFGDPCDGGAPVVKLAK